MAIVMYDCWMKYIDENVGASPEARAWYRSERVWNCAGAKRKERIAKAMSWLKRLLTTRRKAAPAAARRLKRAM